MTTDIDTLLVANRGEIARRIFRTAREMGIRCIAVYVDADADAPFVTEADAAVRLPDGYLDGGAIIEAALSTGAKAVHPGYGFLSENPTFAAAVDDAGLIWVGPSPGIIRTMGDKVAAKQAAIDAGVPTLPSSNDPTDGTSVGFPLLVKASAGGGGKGMHLVESDDSLADSVARAQREALNAFDDDTVFLERYLPTSRHIEIQILGDSHGNLVHLGERECSIQRRHQKIIEESPSPAIDPALRSSMGEAALKLASSIGYSSAGTVEFLLDDLTHEFWFLEVNTRLQVEHPVTEMVTGIDLVREQLRVASGEPLGYRQEDISFTGHAIEARIYAEDPDNDFLPDTGTLHAWLPAEAPAVRWDSGVEQGSVVGFDFDPMLAKVIASGPTRAETTRRLALALERSHLGGVTTNRDFLAASLRSPEFARGDTTTDFIERADPPARRHLADEEREYVAVAAAMWQQAHNHANCEVLENVRSGFVLGRLPSQRISWVIDAEEITIHYRSRRDGRFTIESQPDTGAVTIHGWSPHGIDIEWQGQRRFHRVTSTPETLYLSDTTGTTELGRVPRFVVPSDDQPTGGLVAPMPGVVLDVRVSPGDTVSAGQTLVVLEAMKMEHHMNAPSDGVVSEVRVTRGGHVSNGELLVVFESESESDKDN